MFLPFLERRDGRIVSREKNGDIPAQRCKLLIVRLFFSRSSRWKRRFAFRPFLKPRESTTKTNKLAGSCKPKFPRAVRFYYCTRHLPAGTHACVRCTFHRVALISWLPIRNPFENKGRATPRECEVTIKCGVDE